MDISHDPIALQVEEDIRKEPRLRELSGEMYNAVFNFIYKHKSAAVTTDMGLWEEIERTNHVLVNQPSASHLLKILKSKYKLSKL